MDTRDGLWAAGGAAAATTLLVAFPRAYALLRRLVGARAPNVVPPGAFEPLDERSAPDPDFARRSLRARLAEEQDLDEELPADVTELRPRMRRPERSDSEPMRRAVETARDRVRAKAQAAYPPGPGA